MKLDWIRSDELDHHIECLRQSAKNAVTGASKRRKKNIDDPFSSLLIAATHEIKYASDLTRLKDAESALRGMSNALGRFHQSILASIDGWHDHDAGYDLECPEQKLLAEVKNKWNTMNSANRRKVEEELETAIRQKPRDWHGYLVIVIPRKPVRFTKPLGKGVTELDGASFYAKVTGHPNAIHDLFDYLCSATNPSSEIASHCRDIMVTSLPPRRF